LSIGDASGYVWWSYSSHPFVHGKATGCLIGPTNRLLHARSMMPIATERTANQRSAIYEYLEACTYLNICGGDCERTVRHVENRDDHEKSLVPVLMVA
jgi:radical SAM protein with 4Fe4S-binding SPASM domain